MRGHGSICAEINPFTSVLSFLLCTFGQYIVFVQWNSGPGADLAAATTEPHPTFRPASLNSVRFCLLFELGTMLTKTFWGH